MNYYLFRFTVIPILAFLSVASSCLAVELEWNAGTSNWFTPGNWSPSGPPTNLDWAHVDNGGNAQIATAGAISNIVELGSAAGESGIVSVSGIGTLNVPNLFDIGFSGTGTLNITAGGIVTARTTRIGSNVNAIGLLSVDGGGSSYSAPIDSITVALSGHGTMSVTNGGEVTSFSGFIAEDETAVGVVTINGMGSNWTMSDLLNVAFVGSGTLNILNGGDVTNGEGIIGGASFVPEPVSATGIVNVTGTGSSWTNTGDLTVALAAGATGTVNISNGGDVTSQTGRIGDHAGSTGVVNVDGTGSSWKMSGAGDNLLVGVAGTGTVNITNGGLVSNGNGTIAYDTGSTGTVNISGTGSTWTNALSVTVGYIGHGELHITSGGSVSAGDTTTVASFSPAVGVMTVDGTGSTFTDTFGLVIGQDGNATLHITNGGAVSNTFGNLGLSAGSTGTVTIDGTGSTWTNNGSLAVGSLGTGTMTVTNGGAVHSNISAIAQSLNGNGTAIVDGATSIWTTSSLSVGGDPSGPKGNRSAANLERRDR